MKGLLDERLGISRKAFHARLTQQDLCHEFAFRISDIIHCLPMNILESIITATSDNEYSGINITASLDQHHHAAELCKLEQKYRHLPEPFRNLLTFW